MKILASAVLVAVLFTVVSQASAADTTTVYEPSTAVYCRSSSYAYMDSNWIDWLSAAENGWRGLGPEPGSDVYPCAFVKWDINWATLGDITGAGYKIMKNNEGMEYGIPPGTHLEFALITEDWSTALGTWAGGPAIGTPITVTAPEGYEFQVDVTGLMQTWQASPTTYFGIMARATDSGGGVISPNGEWDGGITAHLSLTTTPEPASLSLLAFGALALLRRRRQA